MTIEARKIYLIKQIMDIENETVLKKLEDLAGTASEQEDILFQLSEPIEKDIDLEKIKKEQNFKPIDQAEINRLIKEADVQEPIEDLLEMI